MVFTLLALVEAVGNNTAPLTGERYSKSPCFKPILRNVLDLELRISSLRFLSRYSAKAKLFSPNRS